MFADDIEFVEKERVTRHEVNQEPFETEMFAKEIRSWFFHYGFFGIKRGVP